MIPVVVLSYNIWAGGSGRLDLIAEVIRTQDPDAVAVLEATQPAVQRLARSLGMTVTFGEARADPLHVAWLTRIPVRRALNHARPTLAKTLLEIELADTYLFATHLASRHEGGDSRRIGEMRTVRDVLRRVRDSPHLLVGDLNALRPDDPVGEPPRGVEPLGEAVPGSSRGILEPLVLDGCEDCYRALHRDEPGYTYTAASPWLRLDYAFASPGLRPRLRACDVVVTDVATRASDHLPLRVEFA